MSYNNFKALKDAVWLERESNKKKPKHNEWTSETYKGVGFNKLRPNGHYSIRLDGMVCIDFDDRAIYDKFKSALGNTFRAFTKRGVHVYYSVEEATSAEFHPKGKTSQILMFGRQGEISWSKSHSRVAPGTDEQIEIKAGSGIYEHRTYRVDDPDAPLVKIEDMFKNDDFNKFWDAAVAEFMEKFNRNDGGVSSGIYVAGDIPKDITEMLEKMEEGDRNTTLFGISGIITGSQRRGNFNEIAKAINKHPKVVEYNKEHPEATWMHLFEREKKKRAEDEMEPKWVNKFAFQKSKDSYKLMDKDTGDDAYPCLSEGGHPKLRRLIMLGAIPEVSGEMADYTSGRLLVREDGLYRNTYDYIDYKKGLEDPKEQKKWTDAFRELLEMKIRDSAQRDYLLAWIRTLMLYPGRKIGVMPILITSGKESGKSLFLSIVRAVVGEHNSSDINMANFRGDRQFNISIVGKRLCVLDEAAREYGRDVEAIIKGVITNPKQSFNDKYKSIKPSFTSNTCFIGSSNSLNCVADPHDSRWFFAHWTDKKEDALDWLKEYGFYATDHDWEETEDKVKFIMAVRKYICDLDYPPVTRATPKPESATQHNAVNASVKGWQLHLRENDSEILEALVDERHPTRKTSGQVWGVIKEKLGEILKDPRSIKIPNSFQDPDNLRFIEEWVEDYNAGREPGEREYVFERVVKSGKKRSYRYVFKQLPLVGVPLDEKVSDSPLTFNM